MAVLFAPINTNFNARSPWSNAGAGGGAASRSNGPVGCVAFERNGKTFSVGNHTNALLRAFAATIGSSSWSVIGSGPTISTPGEMAANRKDNICVFAQWTSADLGANYELKLYKFDADAEAWIAGTTTGGPTHVNDGEAHPVSVIVRADDSVVVFYGTVNVALYYAIHDGASWVSVDNLIASRAFPNYDMQMCDDGSFIHIWYSDLDRTAATYEVFHRSLSSANSLSGEQSIYTQPSAFPDPAPSNKSPIGSFIGKPAFWSSQSKIVLPVAEYQGDWFNTGVTYWQPKVLIASSGGATPSFTEETVGTDKATQMACAELGDGSLVLVYKSWDDQSGTPYAFSYSTRVGGVWNSPTTYFDIDSEASLAPGTYGPKAAIAHTADIFVVPTTAYAGADFALLVDIDSAAGYPGANAISYYAYGSAPQSATFSATLEFFSATLVVDFTPPTPPPEYCIAVPPNGITPDFMFSIEPLEQI